MIHDAEARGKRSSTYLQYIALSVSLFAGAVVVTSCSHGRLYSGPERPRNEVARIAYGNKAFSCGDRCISGDLELQAQTIDGQRVVQLYLMPLDILPGLHEVRVGVGTGAKSLLSFDTYRLPDGTSISGSQFYCTLRFNALPGNDYSLNGNGTVESVTDEGNVTGFIVNATPAIVVSNAQASPSTNNPPDAVGSCSLRGVARVRRR